MASIKTLKKDINYVVGDILDAIYIHEMTTAGKPTPETEQLENECYAVFDDLIAKVNDKKVENRAQHLKGVYKTLENKASELVEKVNAL